LIKIIPTAEIPSCPICLNKPIVGKVTNCGMFLLLLLLLLNSKVNIIYKIYF